jgi:FkbM family methyltransferase
MSYADLTEIRPVDICGETDWHWIKGDTGAFDGPMENWLNSHREKYFKYINNYDVIVTAGTNCGMYARFYSTMFKHVYAFEPEPLAFYCMVNNVQADNVIKLNAALGHGHGIVGIHRTPPGGNEMNVGMNIITQSTDQFKIPLMTIDSLGLEACDVIQLDVEGFEKYAIMGAAQTIERFKPVVIAERFSGLDDQMFMNSLGYVMRELSEADAIYTYKN